MATISFSINSVPLTATKTFTSTDADMTNLLQWASTTYASLIQQSAPTSQFTGSISGTRLTVTNIASGTLGTGQALYPDPAAATPGTVIAPGTYISASVVAGPTYNVSISQTVASTPMVGYSTALVGNGLATGTMNAWIDAEQKFSKDSNVAAVPIPPPMGWS